jgi:hypothetical protein
LLWAAALLTNPSLGIALPFLLLWAAVRAREVVQLPWRIPARTLLLILFCCLPWTIRNYSAFHRFIPIRSSLPFELWIGNNDLFDPHAVNGTRRITRFEETRRYAQLGETAYLSDKQIRAVTFIRQKPALFLHLTCRKIIATWIGTEHPLADFLQADSLLVRIVILSNAILTLGTALGVLLLARRKNPFTFPLVIFPALFPLVYYVTHPSLRYRHPIDPILIFLTVFAAAATLSPKYRRAPACPDLRPSHHPSFSFVCSTRHIIPAVFISPAVQFPPTIFVYGRNMLRDCLGLRLLVGRQTFRFSCQRSFHAPHSFFSPPLPLLCRHARRPAKTLHPLGRTHRR